MLNIDKLDLIEVVTEIKNSFINQKQLSMYRDIHEHMDSEGSFAGDDHVFSIYNKKENEFYFVISPYDSISKKAPQQALIFKNGELQLDFDFTSLADIRTGAMDTLLLKSLQRKDIDQKNILYFGTGSITQWSIKILKACFPELKSVHYINRSGELSKEMQNISSDLDINIEMTTKENIGDFDYIFCHTSTDKPVIDRADKENLKSGAVIASYLTLNNFDEIDDSFWNTTENNVVVSWKKEIQNSKDLKRAEEANKIEEAKLITIQDLLNRKSKIDTTKTTVFRSAGTPIQNAAMLSYVLKNQESLGL